MDDATMPKASNALRLRLGIEYDSGTEEVRMRGNASNNGGLKQLLLFH